VSSPVALSRKSRFTTEQRLILSAVVALLPGTAVYLLDRDWNRATFLEPFVDYQWSRSAVFGAFGGILPSLLHAYAFCVLLMVALWPWPGTRLWVCLLWFAISAFFEWLQSGAGSAWLTANESLLGANPLMSYVRAYSVHGQFDYIDLVASGMGCLAALAVTKSVAPQRHGSQS
jgi:hypothetical protein